MYFGSIVYLYAHPGPGWQFCSVTTTLMVNSFAVGTDGGGGASVVRGVTAVGRDDWEWSLKIRTAAGPLTALGFVINRDCPRYTGHLVESRVAEILAGAVGHIGSGAEYLMHTVAHLEELGLRDRLLWRLQALVAKELAQSLRRFGQG